MSINLFKKWNPNFNILSSVFFILLLSGIIFNSCSSKKESGEYSIKGKILNPTRDFVEFKLKTAPGAQRDTIKLNEDGEFIINVKPDTLSVYSLIYGEESRPDTIDVNHANKSGLIILNKTQEFTLMLGKGYALEISFDAADPRNTLIITGKGGEHNTYVVKKEMLNKDFYLKYAQVLNSNPDTFMKYINDYKNNLESLVSSLPDSSEYFPEGFKEQEIKNLNYGYYRQRINYAKQHLGQFQPDENYFNFMNGLQLNDKTETGNPVFISLITNYSDYLFKKENAGKRTSNDDELGGKYLILKNMFPEQEVQDMILYDYLKKNIRSLKSEWYQSAISDYEKSAVTDSLKKEISRIKETHEKLSSGNTAPDFTYPDINGKNHSLSDYKGKYVYIDVWATWCKPCLYEIPYLKELEENYKKRNIVFMSISIDEDVEKWKKMVAEKDLQGVQIIASDPESKFKKDYIIGGIPRFIFIGPGGEIIDNNTTRPSNAETSEMFDSFSGL